MDVEQRMLECIEEVVYQSLQGNPEKALRELAEIMVDTLYCKELASFAEDMVVIYKEA